MNIFSKFGGDKPQRITGTVNKYYRSQNGAGKDQGEFYDSDILYAKRKRLQDTWTLYAEKCFLAPGVGNIVVMRHYLETRREKVASGLSFRDAFNWVRAHEETPAMRYYPANPFLTTPVPEPLSLIQVKPEKDKNYWRRLDVAVGKP